MLVGAQPERNVVEFDDISLISSANPARTDLLNPTSAFPAPAATFESPPVVLSSSGDAVVHHHQHHEEQDRAFFDQLAQFRPEDLHNSRNAEVQLLRTLIETSENPVPVVPSVVVVEPSVVVAPVVNADVLALEAAAVCGEFSAPAPLLAATAVVPDPMETISMTHASPPVTVLRVAPPSPRPTKRARPSVAALMKDDVEDDDDEEWSATPSRRRPKTSQGTNSSTKNTRRKKQTKSTRKTEEDTLTASTVYDSDNENRNKIRTMEFPASVHGETRLNIKFLNMGTLGEIPQRFGKNNCLIPDGLEGIHQMYEQRWKFSIKHVKQTNGMVFIQWTINNLTTGHRTCVMETMQDALNREGCGRTICNNVLKTALEARAQQIEKEAKAMRAKGDEARASNHQAQVKTLRPKRCTVGLLFFGLLHEQIQTRMRLEEEEYRAASIAKPSF